MSAIRHPNIVQYLCTYQDPDTGLPVLLMELMDDNLTNFLESSTQPIPYHIQVNICHDITLALSFLHSNNIIHRDLSGNNVLLIGNIRAKVTDFGMARLDDLNPQATRLTFTMCPGTDVYMPPEAVRTQPVYSEKVDCFSFGVIIIQILSCQFPKPGDRLKTVRTNDPQFHGGEVEVRVPEIERRHNHISQIDNDQPLMQTAFDCLKDSDHQRPSAQQLLDRVAVLKESPEYIESARPVQEILIKKDIQIQEALEQIQILNSDIETKERTIQSRELEIEVKNATVTTLEGEKFEFEGCLESLRKQHDEAMTAIEVIKTEKQQLQMRLESQIAKCGQILSDKDVQIAEKDKLNRELQGVIRSKEEHYYTELLHHQEQHVQENMQQAETIAARENEIQELNEKMKRESQWFEQENQKYCQENKRVRQELGEKRKEILMLRETIRNNNSKFQQKLLHCQQLYSRDIIEKNQAMSAMEEKITNSLEGNIHPD